MSEKAKSIEAMEDRPKWHAGWQMAIFGAFFGSFFTFSGQWVYEYFAKRTHYFDYYVSPSPSLIQRPDLGGRPFAVTVDGETVENLSTLSVYLANRSGENFEVVPIELRFNMPDGSPVRLVREVVKPDRLSPTTAPTNDPTPVLVRNHVIDVANSADNAETIFYGQYVFATAQPPTLELTVLKAGIKARQIKIGGAEPSYPWIGKVGGSLIVLFFVAAGAWTAWGIRSTFRDDPDAERVRKTTFPIEFLKRPDVQEFHAIKLRERAKELLAKLEDGEITEREKSDLKAAIDKLNAHAERIESELRTST